MSKAVYSALALLFFVFSFPAKAIETLKFCQGQMPPYVFSQQDTGSADGIWPTVFDRIFKEHENVSVKSFVLPWKRCQLEVIKGTFDGLFMATWNAEREQTYSLLPSFHTLRIPYYYSKKHYPNGFTWDSYAELENITLGLQRGYNYYQEFHDAWNSGQLNARYASNIRANLQMLSKGRIDLAWDSERVVTFYLRRLGLEGEITQATGQHRVYEAAQHIGLSKSGKALKYKQYIITRLISMQKSGELAQIINADYSQLLTTN